MFSYFSNQWIYKIIFNRNSYIHFTSKTDKISTHLGNGDNPRTTRTLTTGFSKPSKGNRYLRAKAMGGSVTIPGEGNAEVHSSGSLSAMIGCNCLVELPAGSGPVTPGEEVEVLSFVQ